MGNYISLELCQKTDIKYRQREDYESVMANETVQKIGETIGPVSISLGSDTERMRFIVSPLKCDVILGKKWETSHQAKIDCSNNQICFKHQGNDHVLYADKTIEKASLCSLVNYYKKVFPMFSVLLRSQHSSHEIGSTNQNVGIMKTLSEYSDVFPEKLPKGLPPKSTDENFQIELKEVAKLMKKGLYRMSHTELDEIKKQVD